MVRLRVVRPHLVLMALLCIAPPMAAAGTLREVSELAPVWQLDVAEDSLGLRPRVVVNAFAHRRSGMTFPIPELPLRHVVIRVPATYQEWSFSNEIARLRVRPDGQLESPKPRFVASNQVFVDPLTGRMTSLILADTDKQRPGTMGGDSTATFFAVDKGAVTGDLYRWEESPDRTWALVHTSTGTTVFTRASRSPKAHLEDRIYYGSFSEDGSRYAAVAEQRAERDADPRRGNLRRWILLSRDGEVLRQGNPGPQSLEHLHLSPDGRYLAFERDGPGSGSFGVVLDTGEERRLPIQWAGNHYYSADGRTALDLGRNQLFDLRDPMNPLPVGEPLEAGDDHFVTGAVSGDGTLVAVQMVEPDDRHQALLRVEVFDRNFKQRKVLLRNTLRDGLQFEGRCLFVGTQRDPIPAYFEISTTRGILLYDLSSLGQ